jgi:hypothetical protein
MGVSAAELSNSTGLILGIKIWRSKMATIERALSRTQIDAERLKTIAMFCGVGLVVSLLLAEGVAYLRLGPGTNGLDITAGFF